MPRRRIGSDDHHARPRLLCPHLRKDFAQEPGECLLIRKMAEAAEKQQRKGLSPSWLKIVERRVDARAIAIVDSVFQRRQERRDVIAIVAAANLDPVWRRQHPQFIAQRAQIFPARLQFLDSVSDERQPACDGLEIDVVFK